MNPHQINCIINAHNEKIKEQDRLQHTWWGNYGISAVTFAIDHCLHGNKASTEYIKEPIMSNLGLTEEEIYEQELAKAIQAEEQWIMVSKQKGLPETEI